MNKPSTLSRSYPACWDWPVPVHSHEGWVDDLVGIDLLTRFQDGRCAICGCFESFTHRRRGLRSSLFTDHCHRWNVVRGLLCNRCNSIEGHKSVCRAVRLYRSCPPTDLLDIRVQFSRELSRARARADDIRASNYTLTWHGEVVRRELAHCFRRGRVTEARHTDQLAGGGIVWLAGKGSQAHRVAGASGIERWYDMNGRLVAYVSPGAA